MILKKNDSIKDINLDEICNKIFLIWTNKTQNLKENLDLSFSKNEQIIFDSKLIQNALKECDLYFKKFELGLEKARELRERSFKKIYHQKKKKILKKNEFQSKKENIIQDLSEKNKNRPGQRARREKWERKYGKEANHVKKKLELDLKKSKRESHPSWDAKRKQKEDQAKLLASGKKSVKIIFN